MLDVPSKSETSTAGTGKGAMTETASLSTILHPTCSECGSKAQLVRTEPHPERQEDTAVYQCECGATFSHTLQTEAECTLTTRKIQGSGDAAN
jgi:hypothetical protein